MFQNRTDTNRSFKIIGIMLATLCGCAATAFGWQCIYEYTVPNVFPCQKTDIPCPPKCNQLKGVYCVAQSTTYSQSVDIKVYQSTGKLEVMAQTEFPCYWVADCYDFENIDESCDPVIETCNLGPEFIYCRDCKHGQGTETPATAYYLSQCSK